MIIHSPIISGSLTFAEGGTFTLPDNGVYSGSFSGSYQGDGSNLTFGGTGIVSGAAQLQLDFLDTLGDGVVSGSSQITITDTTGFSTFSSSLKSTDDTQDSRLSDLESFSSSLDSGFVTEGELSSLSSSVDSTINSLTTDDVSEGTNLYYTDARVKTKIDTDGVISGSSQVSYVGLSNIPANIVSGSSQVSYVNLSNIPGGIVSGSSQVDAASVTNFDSEVKSKLDADGVISGSSQVDLGSVSNNTTTNVSEGTNLYYTDARVKTKLDAETVISGSSQVQAGSITGDIALGTQTSGNYVATLGTGTGVTIGSNTGEGSTPTITVDYGSTANTAVQGNTSITFAGTSNEISIDGGSSITLGSGGTVTIGLADSISGNRTFSNDVTITGNLTVNGTTTTVNSNTVSIGDNIFVLNSDETGTPSQNGGIEVERGTSTNSTLLWDEGNDYWVAGLSGAEERIVVGAGNTSITTLGTITTGVWNGTAIANGYLENSTISGVSLGSNLNTLTIGTGLSGTSYNGSSAVTIANTGVLSAVAGTGVSVSGATGNVTFSIGQAVGTGDTVQFSKVGVGGASDATYELKVTGDIGATGDIVAYISSDERLKDNVELIQDPIGKVKELKGVTWEWNENASEAAKQSPNVGVIAQDVEKVLPQLVHDRENGYKGVDYSKLTGLLIEVVKEQQERIEKLEERLNNLEN